MITHLVIAILLDQKPLKLEVNCLGVTCMIAGPLRVDLGSCKSFQQLDNLETPIQCCPRLHGYRMLSAQVLAEACPTHKDQE